MNLILAQAHSHLISLHYEAITALNRFKLDERINIVSMNLSSSSFQVPIIENSVCQDMFQTAGHNKKILPSFLCAGYANGQRDSCEVSKLRAWV